MLHLSEQDEEFRSTERSSEKVRCVLVLEHVLLRQGLRRLLEDEPDLEVSAEAGTPAEAMRRLFEHRPHVVITDTVFFESGSDRAIQLINQVSPRSRVLFLTLDSHRPENDIRTHCALPQTSVEELVQMVREVHRGAPLEIGRTTDEIYDQVSVKANRRVRDLTSREREVLRLLAQGRTVRSVANTLQLSMKTVDAHKSNLMRKLGIHNKAELVMRAIQERVLKLPADF